MCLQQFRVADRFEPECAIFLYMKDAMVQWSKHTAKSMKDIMSATQKTHVSVKRSNLQRGAHHGPGLTSSLFCLPLQRAHQGACQSVLGREESRKGEKRYSDHL